MQIAKYVGRVTYPDGSTHENTYPFTQYHANEVGTICDKSGIPLDKALQLLTQWNIRGKHSSIRYSYALTVEDQLAVVDERRKAKATVR